jgi:hypothetical protein
MLASRALPLLGEGGGVGPGDCATFHAGGEGGFRFVAVDQDFVDVADGGAGGGFGVGVVEGAQPVLNEHGQVGFEVAQLGGLPGVLRLGLG